MAADRRYDLGGIQTDGWFERLGQETPDFDRLCDIFGRRFLAFSIIAGVHVQAVSLGDDDTESTVVEFSVGDSEEIQSLRLSDFQSQLADSLAVHQPFTQDLPKKPNADQLRSYIGMRYLLLAPIFGITLRSISFHKAETPRVELEDNAHIQEMPISQFRMLLHERIFAEKQRLQESKKLDFDFDSIPEAEEANASGQWEKTISMLGSWPRPLAMLLRTQRGQRLDTNVRSTVGRALSLLGTAFVKTGQPDWADEIFRLGIQWTQGTDSAGDLFHCIGESYVDRQAYGQAIGFLRRATSLGAEEQDILPLLVTCFVERERYLTAALCMQRALALGTSEACTDMMNMMNMNRERIEEALGDSWQQFLALVDAR